MNTGPPITPGTRIPLRQIQMGAKLGDGGQGSVHSTDLTFAGRRLVYKSYRPEFLPHVDSAALERMTTAITRLNDADRDRFLDIFAWPLALVTGGGVTGFLMPAVPDGFYSFRGRPGKESLRLDEFQHLLNTPDFVARLGIQLSRQDQLGLLRSTAEALSLLHGNHFAVGDLSPRNLLFDSTARRVYFIDCDAMTYHDAMVLPQAETPNWDLPAGETIGTPDGDAYKFGLLALRLLAGDQDTRDPQRLPSSAQALLPLVQRALTLPPGQRPRPQDWLPVLSAAEHQASAAPLAAPTGATAAQGAQWQATQTAPAGFAPTGFAPVGPAAAGYPAAGFPPPPGPPPGPGRKSNSGIAGAVVGLFAILLVVGVAIALVVNRDSNGGPANSGSLADGSGSTGTPITSFPPSPPADPPPNEPAEPLTTMPSRASTAPAGSTGENCGRTPFTHRPNSRTEYVTLNVTVGATTPATHCNFAMVVADDVGRSADNTYPITVDSASPNTGSTYRMVCTQTSSSPIVIRCSDDNTAVVYFYY